MPIDRPRRSTDVAELEERFRGTLGRPLTFEERKLILLTESAWQESDDDQERSNKKAA